MLLFGALLVLLVHAVPAIGQVAPHLSLAPNVPPECLIPGPPRDKPLSPFVEQELEIKFRPEKDPKDLKDLISFDMSILGSDSTADVLRSGFKWRLEEDETLNLKPSKLTYKTNRWPKTFGEFFFTPFRPVKEFLSSHWQ
ncbi:MAG TPA: hypothetical protein VFT82_02365 [Candidatus Paceibacterota bacterium]|nr:hypothetical protein [Candidatus Paceibacterota bacterium]